MNHTTADGSDFIPCFTNTLTFSSPPNRKEVVSFKFDETMQRIEVVFRQKSNANYACIGAGAVPDTISKEIYGISNGRIALLKVIRGTHTPERFEPESITFDDET